MKSIPFLSLLVFGMASVVVGAEQPLPGAGASGAPVSINHTLDPGRLQELVEQLEAVSSARAKEPGAGGEPWAPTLIYGPGTADRQVAVPLRLSGVNVVDALTLIGAAAGCHLEPISSVPTEQGWYGGKRIIGYRFELAKERHPGAGASMGMEGGDAYGMPGASSGMFGMGYGSENVAPGAGVFQPVSFAKFERTLQALERELEALRKKYSDDDPRIVEMSERIRKALPTAGGASPLIGVGLALARTDDGVVVTKVIPGSPAEHSGSFKPGDRITKVAEPDKAPVEVGDMALEEVVSLIRGAEGSALELTVIPADGKGGDAKEVPLVRKMIRLPKIDPAARKVEVVYPGASIFAQVDRAPNPVDQEVYRSFVRRMLTPEGATVSDMLNAGTYSKAGETAPDDDRAPMVRVYALGSIFKGGVDEAKALEAEFSKLVVSALEMAELEGGKKPELSFHRGLKALVARATPGEHAMIEQVLEVMQANEAREPQDRN